eukprot:6492782-Amphidinium_carterae.5
MFLTQAWAKLEKVHSLKGDDISKQQVSTVTEQLKDVFVWTRFGMLIHFMETQKQKKTLREDCQAVMKELRGKFGKAWEKDNMPTLLYKKVKDIMDLQA